MRVRAHISTPRAPDESGQASVEYAVVFAGMLALVLAFGALHAFLEDGKIIEHVLRISSHAVEMVHIENLGDVMSV